jgi:hypothetical protein
MSSVIAVHGLDFMDADEKCSNSSWQQPSNTQLTEGWLKAFFQDLSFRNSSWGVQLFLYEYDSTRTFCSSAEGSLRRSEGLSATTVPTSMVFQGG